ACPSSCTCTASIAFFNSTTVDCSFRSLTKLPIFMPSGCLYIDISLNSISILHNRDYLNRALSFNISTNKILHVNADAVARLQNVKFLDLSFNQLLSIPLSFRYNLFNKTETIFLLGNEWKCSCANVWMGEWINTNS
ncbi:hypothetical protein LOTGIDRAFT_77591, partial [Lottia gigantea]